MSGIEIVALVGTLVSAFTGAASLYNDWRKVRQERKTNGTNEHLHALICASGPQVQIEYDRDYRRLGLLFARGDDIGRNALMEQIITLQGTVIQLLTTRGPGELLGHVIHPNHETLLLASSTARERSLSTLRDQAQRVIQAAPIQRPPAAVYEEPDQAPSSMHIVPIQRPPPVVRQPAAAVQSPEQINGAHNCFAPMSKYSTSCRKCPWRGSLPQGEVYTKDERLVNRPCLLSKFHACERKGGLSYFRCFICKDGIVMDGDGMREHCLQHTAAEICGHAVPVSDCCATRPKVERVNADFNCHQAIDPHCDRKRAVHSIHKEAWTCDCGWRYQAKPSVRRNTTGLELICFMRIFHAYGQEGSNLFCCFICKTGEKYEVQKMLEHISNFHSKKELVNHHSQGCMCKIRTCAPLYNC